MQVSFKTLLICLLLALLPLQGFAMAAASCAATHQHGQATTMHAQHLAAHCHDAGDTSQHTQHTHANCCGGCAACCVGVINMTAPVSFTVPLDVQRLSLLSPPLLFVGHTPAVPKRPPRLLNV